MFYDIGKIFVKGGNGGDGIVAFRREKFVPDGGPSGGDGGRGSDIILLGDEGLHTLIDFKYKKHYKGPKGENGKNNNMHGAKAEHVYVKVPLGTIIKDSETLDVIGDITEHGQTLVIAKGGRGGRGNARFKTNKNKAPRFCEHGEPGEEKNIVLELKLMADVGLCGYPNSGKSTFINKVSNSKSKIGAYPFTTLEPRLGVVEVYDETYVLADIPGLIDGASEGVGLGHEFLKHLERTRLILHIIDGSNFIMGKTIFEDFVNINKELENYHDELINKEQIILVNKMDIPGVPELADEFEEKLRAEGYDYKVFKISAFKDSNLDEVNKYVMEKLKDIPVIFLNSKSHKVTKFVESDLEVVTLSENYYEVIGSEVERLFRMSYLESDEGIRRFYKQLISLGVVDKLKEAGVKEEDSVLICGLEFEYTI